MKELVSLMTRKGQVTVPVEVRRALGLHQGDRIAFVLQEDGARLLPAGSIVGRTAGVFRARGARLSAEELRRRAEQAMAEDLAHPSA